VRVRRDFLHRVERGSAPLRRVSVQHPRTGAPLLEIAFEKSLACGLLLPSCANPPRRDRKLVVSSKRIAAGFILLTAAMTALGAGKGPEKEQLKLGFIKLTDMAPLAIAYEKGFFEDEGLYVTLEPQANWKVILDRVITGELDGAHMLAGQPIGASIGIGTKAEVVTGFSMDLNGNAITVSNEVWGLMKPALALDEKGLPKHPISASALKPALEKYKNAGKPFRMAMVFPVSTHNYELRYWLAAGGINPGFYSPADITGQTRADVLISVTSRPSSRESVYRSSPTTRSGRTIPKKSSVSPRPGRRKIRARTLP
jgi:hypothetical protein